MDWTPGDLSDDIEDRRSSPGGGGFGLGGGSGLGLVGIVIVGLISLVTGRNFLGAYLSGAGNSGNTPATTAPRTPGATANTSPNDDRDAQLVSFVLTDAQKTWTQIFAQSGKEYRHAKLVLYRGATYSGCGTAQATTGPFYCPADEKIYIDLGFWDDLKRFGGDTGEFAQAYVIAHELGHHVQKLLGTEGKVSRLEREEPGQRNHLSVDLELQADCYAGIWAHSTEQRHMVKESDIDGALKAAAAVGDDHLQRMSGRAVSPESFTHGASAQRTTWFRRGLEQGSVAACNTFGGSSGQ